MSRMDDLQKRYEEVAAMERKAFWAATAASFDVSDCDTGAYLTVGAAASKEMHDRAEELWKNHRVLDEELKRIIDEAFRRPKIRN